MAWFLDLRQKTDRFAQQSLLLLARPRRVDGQPENSALSSVAWRVSTSLLLISSRWLLLTIPMLSLLPWLLRIHFTRS